MALISNWKHSWKLATVKWATLVALLPELIYRVADIGATVMPLLSEEVKGYLPGPIRAAFAFVSVVAIALRVYKQKALTYDLDKPH